MSGEQNMKTRFIQIINSRRWVTGWLLSAASLLRAADVVRSAAEPDYPPLSIVNSDGQAGGFTVDLLRAALKETGREVTFKVGPWAEIKQELADGKLEVLPLVGRTPEREALFDFTIPYLTLHGALFVRQDTTDIQTLDDLKGKRVAVMKGDNAEEYVRRVRLSEHIITTGSFEEAFQMLSAGRADAVIAQKLMGVTLLKHLGVANVRVVGKPNEEFKQDFCFAVRKGNGKLLAVLNEGLAIATARGISRQLEQQWLGVSERETALARVIVYGGDHAFPPYEFLDAKGRPAGLNIDLARAIARETGADISFQLAPWDDVRPCQHVLLDATRAPGGFLHTPHTGASGGLCPERRAAVSQHRGPERPPHRRPESRHHARLCRAARARGHAVRHHDAGRSAGAAGGRAG
jgi:ABC-type amino acid transport substrate-binding protein